MTREPNHLSQDGNFIFFLYSQVGISFFGKPFGQGSLGYNYLLPTVTFEMEKQVSFILKVEKTFLWKSGRGEKLPATLRVPAHIQVLVM